MSNVNVQYNFTFNHCTLIYFNIEHFTYHVIYQTYFSLLLSNSDDIAPHAVTRYIVHEGKLIELS